LLVATVGLAESEVAGLTDRELKAEKRLVDSEYKSFRDLEKKLISAGRQSNSASRKKIIERIDELMRVIVLRREDILGVEHTIIKHGETVKAGTTKSAEAGTPVAGKKSRRQMKHGVSPHSEAFLRLSRMQTIIISGRTIYRQAVEKQGDALDRFQGGVEVFGGLLELEHQMVNQELETRQKSAEEKKQAQDKELDEAQNLDKKQKK